MGENRTKPPVQAAYQPGLVEAIRKFLPAQFFSQWSVRGSTVWTPQRLVWLALLMVWNAEQTLDARFRAMRQILQALFPKWKLGTTYTGWNDAQARWLERLRPRVTRRLQQQMQAGAGRCWLREGWCAFAAEMNFLFRVGANVRLLRKLGAVQERSDTVYLWPDERHREPPLVLRLLRRRQGNQTMDLVTNVLDEQRLSAESAGVLDELRWGVEVFYRSLKQTLQKRKMLSRTLQTAAGELTWAVLGMWLLGLMSVTQIIARGGQPLSWSAAVARERVRQSLRLALAGRRDRALVRDLGQAVRDAYQRQGSKKARDWPHKKTEKPPGSPNILTATAQQRRAAERLRANEAAA
jgi:hypothetical protein